MPIINARRAALLGLLVLLTGCRPLPQLDISRLTGGTASATPTTAAAGTAVIRPSPEGAAAPPTPLPEVTAEPSTTALPPTATPAAELPGTLCRQTIGDVRLGFSAQLEDISWTPLAAGGELVLRFAPAQNSAPPAAELRCLRRSRVGEPGAFALEVALPGWQRDALFAASPITAPLMLGDPAQPRQLEFLADAATAGGLTLRLALDSAHLISAARSADGRELRVTLQAVADDDLSDPLAAPSANTLPSAAPFLLISAGDVWLVDPAKPAEAVNLTNSVEVETAAALGNDGRTVVFCRAAVGYEPRVGGLPVPSQLLRLTIGEGVVTPLAAIGGGCTDPAISRDLQQAAFIVQETADEPALFALYLVPLDGSAGAVRIGEPVDAWSRSRPQWLADGTLAYLADAGDGRRSVRLRYTDGTELDVGDSLLVSPALAAMYDGFAGLAVSPDGTRLALELLRSADDGADLLVVAADGAPLDLFGADVFWSAPLGWDAQGRLLVLQTRCASDAVQPYRVVAWQAAQALAPVTEGLATRYFGPAAVDGSTLFTLRDAGVRNDPRGPLAPADGGAALELWAYDLDSGQARLVLDLPEGAGLAFAPR